MKKDAGNDSNIDDDFDQDKKRKKYDKFDGIASCSIEIFKFLTFLLLRRKCSFQLNIILIVLCVLRNCRENV